MFELDGDILSVEDIQSIADSLNISYDDAFAKLAQQGLIQPTSTNNMDLDPQQEPENVAKSEKFDFTFKNVANDVFGPSLSILSSFAKGVVDITDSAFDLAEAAVQMQNPVTSHLYFAKRRAAAMAGMTYDEFEEQIDDPYNIVDLSGVSNFLDKSVIKFEDEEGKRLDYTELAEQGRYGDAATSFVMETAGAAPSLIVSMAPGGYALLGGTSFIDKLNTDLVERPDETISQIMGNAVVFGGADMVGEYFGGRFLRKMVKGVVPRTGAKIPKEVEDAMVGGVGGVVRSIFKGGGSEFMQESITSVIQSAGDELIYGDETSASQYFRKALHAGMIGFALGGGTGTVSTLKNRKDNEKFYEYLAPKSYKKQQVELSQALEEAESDLENAPADNKDVFQKRVDDIKNKKQELKDQLYDRFQTMQQDENEMQYYLDNLNDQHKQLDIITGGRKFSDSAKNQAKKDFTESAKNNEDLFAVTDLNYDKDVELELSKYFKLASDIDNRNKNLWFKAKDLSYEYIDTQEKFDELKKQYGKDIANEADGFFETTVDGKKKIFINRDVAAMAEATNVIGHELLHYAISNRFANDPQALRASVVEFTKYLDQVDPFIKKSIEKRLANPKNRYAKLDANGKVQRDQDGLIVMNKESYIEEYFNMFSDLIDKKKIKAVEEASDGIKNSFRSMVRGLGGFSKVDFNSGQEVFNLLIDYNKNINREGLLGRVTQKKIIETVSGKKVQAGEAGVSKSMTAEQKATAESEIKRLGREGLVGDNLREKGIGKVLFDASFEDIYSRIKSEGYLDNLIASKFKGDVVPRDFVDKVYSELTSHAKNFNPEQNDDFFGYLNSQIANKAGNVYNREYKVDQTAAGRARDIGETTQEGEIKVQVEADTDAALEALETEDLSVAGRARAQAKEGAKQSKFRRAIGFETDGKNYNNILDATKKSLALAYRKTQDIKDPAKRARAIKKILREEYFTKGLTSDVFKPLKNFLGTKDYIKNLKQHREAIVEAISTADFVQIERKVPDNERIFTTFVRKLTSKKEVEDAVNRDLLPLDALNKIDKGQAVNLYKKRMPTEAEFIEFADQPAINPVTGARSGLKGTRKDGFAKAMGNTLVLDAVMEARQSDDVIGLIDQDVQTGLDIQELSAAIGRDVDIKFSKTFNKDVKDFMAAIKKHGVDEILTPTGRIRRKNGKPVFGLNTPKYITDFYADLADDRPGQFEFFVHEFDTKGFKRVQDRLPKGATKGDVYEALMQELSHQTFAKELGLKVYSKDQVVKAWPKIFESKINKNDIPDIIIWDGKKNGVLFTIETKVGPARAGSYAWNDVSFNKVDANGNWIKEWPMAELLSDEQLKQLSEPLIEPIKKLTSVLNINNAQDVVSIPDHLSVGRNGKGENKNLKFAVRSTTSVDASFLREYYNSGRVKLISTNAIQIQGVGIFHLGNDVHNLEALGINQLEGTFDLTVRIMPRSVKKRINKKDVTVGYRYGLRAELQLRKSKITSKAALDLGRAADAERIAQHVVNQTSARERSVEKAILASRSINSKTESRGMSTFDFDETLIIDGKNFITATKGDDVVKISSGDWPLVGSKYAEQGYEFDFSDFVNVRGGVDGPLLQKMKNQIKKYGPDNVYVLTARPAESATAIHEWLKSKDINIPLSNITGLGNSTGEAKALWMLDKFAEGYNDMYFVDDALPNVEAVKNVLDQLDVKGKSVQARIQFSRTMSDDFNKMLERTKGVPFDEAFSRAKALRLGKNKGKFQIFVPPSADDFEGLLYYFVGKSEQGNKDLEFFKQAVIDPFSRAYTELDQSRQTIINDWDRLRKNHKEVTKKLGKMMPGSEFTFDNAIRVYLYNKAGHSVPGLSEQEVDNMVERVKTDKALLAFAENLQVILKLDEVYVKPNEYWVAGSTASDVQEVSEKIRRAEFLGEWVENKNEIFSEENLNKVEAIYGSRFRSALEDVLYRMETGRTRSEGSKDAISSRWMRWLNNSVGAIMFINVKSSLLQTISMINYVNYVDNNPYQAAKAFANQKQYWADFTMIFNSDFLKQRRKGLKTDVQTAEIASAVANATNKAQAAVAYLLKKGFLPTQMADSFAIAAGGATFYRNRVKTYLNEGLSKKEAEEKAFNDFRNTTEESQQSARPDRLSQQQVSNAGRLLLNFQNYPMQQARLFKKAILGLARGTGSRKEHLSRIVFYGFAQNMIFLSLQNALFAMLFDIDDEEEKQELFDTKMERILNGMVDTMLRGSGITGGVIATAKNTMLTAIKELDKKGTGKFGNVVLEALNLSPAIGSKLRKIAKGYKNYDWNRDAINEISKLDIDNPIWTTAAPVIEGVTNAPTDRTIRLINQVREGFNPDNSVAQRMSILLGFSPYEIGVKPIGSKKVKEAKKESRQKGTSLTGKNRCAAFTSSGGRCKNQVKKGKRYCYAHD
jgi:hypothetical protein